MQEFLTTIHHRTAINLKQTSTKRAALHIYLLGPLRIEWDGKAIHLPRRKVESLVAYLLLHPEAHSRDHLATLLWGDSSDSQARHSLRTALATIRSTIAPDFLLTDRDYIQRNPDFPCWVDLWAVLDVDNLRHGVIGEAASTLALWQGELLAGHYDEWVHLEREHYRTRLITLCLQVIQSLRERSDYAKAITVAQQVLYYDPANEPAHQHLIFCYMAAGDRMAALRQYELCERALRDELAVPPLPETTALYHWIQQKWDDTQNSSARITNLPIPLTSFIGRARESAALKRLLSYGTGIPRLVTLTGAGGTGKTRLAIQVATDLIDHFLHGVWWVELAALTDGDQLVKAVGKTLGLCDTSQESCRQRLIDFLTEKQMLLVIDNCEHLLDASAQLVTELLRAAPELQIMATSRVGLGVAGEQIWQVPTLPLPELEQDDTPEQLRYYECLQLFVERAAAVQPGFTLTTANAPAVVEICRQLDGIPLAIELAAARVKVLAVDEIAAYLKRAIGARFALLTQGSRTGVPRQQTLRATIDWSYALLNEVERRLFRHVAIFHGSFTLAAIGQVTTIGNDNKPPVHGTPFTNQEVLDQLTQLVDQSLVIVETEDGQHRYRLLETLREYALSQYENEAEKRIIQERHATYYLEAVETAARDTEGLHQAFWLHCAEVEQPNLRAALDFLIHNDDGDRALRFIATLYRFWDARGYLDEGRHWLRLALTKRSNASLELQAEVLHIAGWLAYGQSDLESALPYYTESLVIYESLGDTAGVFVLQNLALLDMEQGEYLRANERLNQSMAICRARQDDVGVARAFCLLGALAWEQAEVATAHHYFTESFQRYQRMDNQYEIANGYLKLGDTERLLGNDAAAEAHYQCVLTLAKPMGNRWLIGNTYNGLAYLTLARRDYGQAHRYGEEALKLFQAIGDPSLASLAMTTLGAIHKATGRHAEAYQWFCQSLMAIHQRGYPSLVVRLFGEIADLLVMVGQQPAKATHFLAAAEQLRHIKKINQLVETRCQQQRLVTRLQQILGEACFAEQWQAGQAMPLDQLLQEATSLVIN